MSCVRAPSGTSYTLTLQLLYQHTMSFLEGSRDLVLTTASADEQAVIRVQHELGAGALGSPRQYGAVLPPIDSSPCLFVALLAVCSVI